jgi:hypothetical protein
MKKWVQYPLKLYSLNAVASREIEFDSLQRRCGVGRDVNGNARIERQE